MSTLRFITGFYLLFYVSNVLEEKGFFYKEVTVKEINKIIVFSLGTSNII